LKAIFAIKADG